MALTLRQSARQQPLQMAEKQHIPIFLDHPVRELLQNQKGPFFIATPAATRLDDIATLTYHAAPDDLARLGFAIAHALDANAPAVQGLPDELSSLANRIAQALKEAQRPLVISGSSCGSEAVIQAAANVARSSYAGGRRAGLTFLSPECNSMGLVLMGGGSLTAALQAVESGAADTVIILENDLYRRALSPVVDKLLDTARHAVVLDSLANRTTAKAELVLPAATFAEADGTLINNEGRAQRSFNVFPPAKDLQESWRWLRDVMVRAGRQEASAWQTLDDIWTTLAQTLPALAHAREAAPPSTFRLAGCKIPREPHRWSGRTAVLANINVSEPKPPEDPDTPLSYTMEGYPAQPPAPLTPFFWSGGWNSIRATLKYQEEVNGPLRGGDAGVRLIEPAPQGNGSYFTIIPAAFESKAGEWLIVALHHIFGSEELSHSAPALMELAPQAYVALHPDDASKLRVEDGKQITVELTGRRYQLPVKIRPDLPKGIAGVPVGLGPMEGIPLPAWGRVSAGL
jgi:NADH-quinone oxidoreductase subunit G